MALITGSYLNERASIKMFSASEKFLLESRPEDYSFDIFLSHSFLDKKKVQGLYNILTALGYSVYVDWINDPQLNRNNVTQKSAELVRKRMKASKSLLLAISSNASLSKWIPWELGYIDGNVNKCAIVPVSDDLIASKKFDRAEYLLLYPYIKLAKIDYQEKLYLVESGNNYVSLENWLKRNSKPLYESVNIDFI
jgi:hypothetical protein